MKHKAKKTPPLFASEAQERAFWESHDSTEYLDWSAASQVVLPNLKPTTKTISLRLPAHLLDNIKTVANARDVPYQSLIKIWLQEKVVHP
ncbi:MAG: BrnA antitoxin family protein [Deltaproteobacteria bacterium]|nr:BrnA antitoxin family protein [Deltaproteobacteria bacterium]